VAGAFILRLAQALAEARTDVRVLAPAAEGLPDADSVEGIPVRRFRYAPARWQTLAYTGTMAEQVRGSPGGYAKMAALLARGCVAVRYDVTRLAPDIVHAHWWFPGGVVALGAPRSLPIVATLHGSDIRLARTNRVAPILFRHVVARCAAVTAVSGWLAGEARVMAPGREVAVEPMPADVALFTPGGSRHAARMLFVGRLNAQKGIALLLEALAVSAGGASLDVVGDGPDRAALEARVVRLGLATRVVFHGARAQPELVPFYRSATAVVVPSEHEGLGLVAVEAHLCEAPVIACRSGGLTDVVAEGETGLLAPPGDARALAAAMDALLARADRGAALGRAGRIRALARFAPASVAARYRALYDRAVTRVA